eukprot:SAG11_NODE_38292_length_253_cov_0.584416_2_plen_55_part_01
MNAYGPTEAAVAVSTMRCAVDMPEPILSGTPFNNVCTYIVDPTNVSVALASGVPG